jgi:hypothetical protein
MRGHFPLILAYEHKSQQKYGFGIRPGLVMGLHLQLLTATYRFLASWTEKLELHFCNQMHEICVHSDDAILKNYKTHFIQVKTVTRKKGKLILKLYQITINHFIKLQVTSPSRKGPVPSGVFDETD